MLLAFSKLGGASYAKSITSSLVRGHRQSALAKINDRRENICESVPPWQGRHSFGWFLTFSMLMRTNRDLHDFQPDRSISLSLRPGGLCTPQGP